MQGSGSSFGNNFVTLSSVPVIMSSMTMKFLVYASSKVVSGKLSTNVMFGTVSVSVAYKDCHNTSLYRVVVSR